MYEKIVKSFQQIADESGFPADHADRVVEELTDSLRKALTLGNYPATAGTTTSDAGPLRLQNLDSTLTSVLFSEQHIKLWNFLTKTPSTQPYYEWNRRRDYGSSRGSSGFAEGGAPKGSVSKYERAGAYTKYLGVRRGITHQLSLTSQLGGTALDATQEENRNGTMELMENIERSLTFSDSAIKSESGADVNFDGFLKQMKSGQYGTSTNVVDLAGKPLRFGQIEDAAEVLYSKGYVTNFNDLHMFITPTILADLAKLKYESGAQAASGITAEAVDRRVLSAQAEAYMTGMPLKGHQTNFGFIGFDPWIFTDRVKGDVPLLTAGDANAPAQPGAFQPVRNAGPVAGSKFTATNGGALVYTIAAFNDSGESIAKVATAATASVGNTDSVTITFPTAPATTTGWRVYRGLQTDGSDAKWIADVAVANATATDLNAKIPGTGYAFIWNRNPDTMTLSQMTPLIRFPLAIVSTTVEWLLLLYFVPVLKAGERVYIFENVGRL